MYRLTQNKPIIILLTLTFLLTFFIGCSEDISGDGNGEAPLLPPDDSMTLDLSLFGGGKLEAPVLPSIPGSRLNFTAAATTALVINTIVVARLSVPVAVFTAAKSAIPVKQDDDSWLWSYSRTIGVETFTANLTGKREGDQVVWSMKVSNTSSLRPLDNFEWYTGVTSRENGSGSWQFFNRDTPEQANPTYAIEWNVERGVKRERTFTNQEAGSPYFGNVVRYAVEGGMASISFTEADKGSTTIIEWSLNTSAGSITSPGYKKGEKACWGPDKLDIACE
ncbi:TPA: hypothetical protein EYP66_14820 [Candidatus Poribacteria bacterium]|nr:hypothetical protein [Candidatus Poribacteria bacterium]